MIYNTVNKEICWQNYLAQDEHLTKKSLEARTERSRMDEPMPYDPKLHENLQSFAQLSAKIKCDKINTLRIKSRFMQTFLKLGTDFL